MRAENLDAWSRSRPKGSPDPCSVDKAPSSFVIHAGIEAAEAQVRRDVCVISELKQLFMKCCLFALSFEDFQNSQISISSKFSETAPHVPQKRRGRGAAGEPKKAPSNTLIGRSHTSLRIWNRCGRHARRFSLKGGVGTLRPAKNGERCPR